MVTTALAGTSSVSRQASVAEMSVTDANIADERGAEHRIGRFLSADGSLARSPAETIRASEV